MIARAGRTRGFWLVVVLVLAPWVLGCGGGAGASGGAGTTESPAGPASSTRAAAAASSTVSASDVAAAKRVVEQLIAAVNDDDFTLARSLMVDPDHFWSIDDMKAIRSIRLESVRLMSAEGPNEILLETDLTRDPPPEAGNPEWPNFMLLVRDASGSWRVAETATGP
jgi:hypothetical protein